MGVSGLTRLERVQEEVRRHGLKALICLTPTNTHYLTHFMAKYYFRPIVLVVSDQAAVVIPDLELHNARATCIVPDLRVYSDLKLGGGASGKTALMLALEETVAVLKEQGIADGPIGFEKNGFSYTAYRYLSEILPGQAVPVENLVERFRMVKEPGEIEMLRRALGLAEHGLATQVRFLRDGVTEVELMAAANYEILMEGARRYPDCVLWADSRPLSGSKTVLPHAWSTAKPLRKGDVVILVADAAVNGYHAEVERTFILGSSTPEQRRVLQVVIDAGQAALAKVRPGVMGLEVDRAAREVVEKAGLIEYFLHRTGHAIGLEEHDESPYFSSTDETLLEPGMVMSVEPGVYLPGVGGFCNADVIVVTEDGFEPLSRPCPLRAEDLVVPEHGSGCEG